MNRRISTEQDAERSHWQSVGSDKSGTPQPMGPHYHESSPPDRYGGRTQPFEVLRVHQVMTRQLAAIPAGAPLEHAARIMAECDIGALPVLDDGGRLVGMVTDRDIALRVFARGLDPWRSRVADCMTPEVLVCHANDRVVDCMRQMSRHQIRRIPVIDDAGCAVGILTQADIARDAGSSHEAREQTAVADVLCAISEPTHVPHR